MTPEQYELVRELYHELADESTDVRQQVLEDRKVDPKVIASLEKLLGFDDRDDEFEDSRLGQVGQQLVNRAEGKPSTAGSTTPGRIGPFRILYKVGEGGMGVVYAAQEDGAEEIIALKLIRPGMDTTQAIARFRREASILRRLRHPGIALFHDAGKVEVEAADGTSTTQLYLAMELVAGEPLFQYVDRERPLDRERLEVIARICDAVQHAHDHGIVHRDLKPSNILVTKVDDDPVGLPRVMDFGVARVTDSDSQTMTMTDPGVLIGTVPYMSPEQVSGRTSLVGPRSDIYSLGVLTYELLVARLPYPVRGRPLPEMARIIQEDEPRRIGSVERRFRGDVETIIAKALEKEPHRRYDSASELAADLRRFLQGKPITARPPTWTRQLVQISRQHRLLASAIGGAFVALLVGLATTLWFAIGAMNSRDLAQATAYRASLTAAAASLDMQNVVEAEYQLNQAPESLRQWEWSHLQSSLDDSLIVYPLPERPDMVRLLNVDLAMDEATNIARIVLREPPLNCARMEGPPGAMKLLDHAFDSRSYLGPQGRWWYTIKGATVEVRDAETGELHSSTPVESDEVHVVPSSNPDRWIAFTKRTLSLMGQDAPDLSGRENARGARSSISDNGELIVWQAGGHLRTWRSGGSEQSTSLSQSQATQVWLKSNPRGTHFVRVQRNGPRMELWRAPENGPPVLISALEGHRDRVHAAAFSTDGQTLVTAGEDRSLRFWNGKTGDLQAIRTGHQGRIEAIDFIEDDRRVMTVGADHTMRVWSATGQDDRVIQHPDYVYVATFSPDGKRVYSGCWDGRIRAFDAGSGSLLGSWEVEERAHAVHSFAVHPDGSRAAVSLAGRGHLGTRRISILDLENGVVVKRLPLPEPSKRAILDYSPDGGLLAYQTHDSGTAVLRTLDWQTVATSEVSPQTAGGASVRFSTDGRLLAISDPDFGVQLCDPLTLRPVRTLTGPQKQVSDLAFSPDGKVLAAACHDWNVYLWNVDGGEPEVLRGHVDAVYSVCFSPDGTRIASGSNDHSVRLWEAGTRTALTRIQRHRDYVYDLEFSPDGRQLVTGSGDRSVGIWGADTVAERMAAREQHEHQSIQAEQWIADHVAELPVDEQRQRIRQEPSFSDREREIALQVLLSRAWASNQ